MPTKVKYYLVRFVNLITGKFIEKEMSEFQLDILLLFAQSNNPEPIQILEKKLIRVESLLKN